MKQIRLFRLLAVVTAMMCALGIQAAEAYACYTSSNTTLTFYYDNQRSSRPGTTYDLNTGSNDTGWETDGTNANVTKVVFDTSFADARPTTTYGWFYHMANLQSITGIEHLNTSEVTKMGFMFYGCNQLTSLDVSHFNTSKVTSMAQMFGDCSSLTSLDLSGFNTSQITNMNYMFFGCSNLRTIYVGDGWSTAAVTNSNNMFKNCTSLVGGEGTTYSASNPMDKTYAHIDGGASNPGYFTEKGPEAYACYTESNTTLTFYYDNQRSSRPGTTYDLNTGFNRPGWDTDGTKSNVTKVVFDPSFADARPTSTYDWFFAMSDLESFTGMSYLNTSEVTNMNYMFCSSIKLTNLDLSSFNTAKVTDMRDLFQNCHSLISIDLSSFNTSQVVDMYYMFGGSNNLRTIYVGNGWSTEAVIYSDNMFYGCTSLVGGQGTTYSDSNPSDKTYAHIDGGSSNPGYFTEKGPEAYACYTPSNTTLTFYYDNYRNSRPGTTYDLNMGTNDTGWETDGTNANVTKVVFDSSFAGARPTTTYGWFYHMANLQSITGIEHLNTSEVTKMGFMFYGCNQLTSLDLSHFNTSLVTTMSSIFNDCSSLTSLDLSGFNTSQITNMNYMFFGCSNLRTIYVGNGWSTAAVTYSNNMFKNCTSLVGGKGTTYSASNPMDKTYAHIDGGTNDPGYFTSDPNVPEAYACYTESNTTLTFYYDSQRNSRPGTTYDLNTGSNRPGWDTDGTKSNVTKVVFDPSFADARPTTTDSWFYEMENLQSITGMSYLNTSEVTRMDYMFSGCNKLTSIDVSHFNTSNVQRMHRMFVRCSNLTSLDLSSFNTSQVTDMAYMFNSNSNLRTIYVGDGWSTAAVTNSNYMFYNCTSLVGGQGTTYSDSNPMDKTYAHIDGGTSNPGYFTTEGDEPWAIEAYACYTPSNTTLTFYYDKQRNSRPGTTYDLNTGTHDTGWHTDSTNAEVTKVVFDPSFVDAHPTTTYYWFYFMTNLQYITGMEYLNTSEVTKMGYMFTGCNQLTSIDLSHFNTSKVTDMGAMFAYCDNLTSLDLSSFNTSQVTEMSFMFYVCSNLRTIYVGNGWSTAAVTNSYNMFYNCTSLVGGQGTTYNSWYPMDKTYAHIDGGPSYPGFFTRDPNAPEAYACYTETNTTLTFYCDKLRSSRPGTTYDLNTGNNVTDWENDGTNANVTKVVFDSSFADARPMTTYAWFYYMENLQSITGMNYLNTGDVTNMGSMFCKCTKLTSLDLSSFNTSQVTSMWGIFFGCSSLTSLDLSSFNTSQVTRMISMFYDCSSLTNLDLSSFNTSQVTDMGSMFRGCSNLRTVYVGDDWSTAAVTYSKDMFDGCTSLVGALGTTYNASNPTDKTYAHIDGGSSNPGYFSANPEAYACYTESNTTLTFYYDGLRSSRPGTTYDLNTGNNDTGWDTDGTNANVTKVVFDPSFAGARPTTTCDWFYNMSNLQSIMGMNYLNTSEVTHMGWMFSGCTELTNLDLSNFNTSNVTNMWGMFILCSSLTSLDLSSFNTSQVTDMTSMFNRCINLRTIYVGNGWSTATVTSSTWMFYDCTSLVGGQGTTYNANYIDKTYAHIDGGPSNPGYFTDKVDFLRGDVDGDGNVGIGDVTSLIDFLLNGASPGVTVTSADTDLDGKASIGDVTALIDYLLNGVWPMRTY